MTTLAAPLASLPSILAFARTFEGGSFTAGARALHLTPAAVSRSVARLEAQLGAPLFRRTTRQLRPTPAGMAYYERCAQALALLAEAEASAGARGAARGRVRLSVPTTLGLHRTLASLEGFLEAHPGVELDVHVGSHAVDFVREGFDLAVRLGPIEDASLVARKLVDATLGVFASPGYLERHGRPRTVAALAEHRTIAFVLPRSGRVLPWLFASPNEELVPRGAVRCLEDPQGMIALARAGVGLACIYHFMVERELAEGSLLEVLSKRAGRTRAFFLVYPKAQVTPAARALIDHLIARR